MKPWRAATVIFWISQSVLTLEDGDLKITAIICIAGGVVGLIVAAIANWLVLPMVLQSQERLFLDPTIRIPFPALLGDARRLRTLTIAVYRYVMPLMFASVGAIGAYYLFIADTPLRHPLCQAEECRLLALILRAAAMHRCLLLGAHRPSSRPWARGREARN